MSGLLTHEADADADAGLPPPPSQSHFAKFDDFTPNDAASFDDEFARLASSQHWVPGSQEYSRQRTIAIREELELHYFSQPDSPSQDAAAEPALPAEQGKKLKGYQALCREVGITMAPSGGSVAECKRRLRSTLVNIVDLIDARRTGRPVEVWDDFAAFAAYTLQDEKRIDSREAKGEGYLASLLQRLTGPGARSGRRGRRAAGKGGSRLRVVVEGRIGKPRG